MEERKGRSVEVSARTVEEAVTKALHQLGLVRDQVDVEVIRPGSRGLLGLLGEEAVVRVAPKGQPAPRQAEAKVRPEARVVEEPSLSTSQAVPPRQAEAVGLNEADKAPAEVAQLAVTTLQELLNHMGLRTEVALEPAPDDAVRPGGQVPNGAEAGSEPVLLNINGDDLGILIGRQGETLRDLQFMTALIVSRHAQHWPNLVVDVEHYKARRQKALMDLAKRMAERVRASGQPLSLEPMPPNERRIVHLALRDDPDVFTESTGLDDKRRVVIMLKPLAPGGPGPNGGDLAGK
jgi:spoIIIJ-associated protein